MCASGSLWSVVLKESFPRLTAFASAGNLLKIETIGPYPRLTEGLEPRNLFEQALQVMLPVAQGASGNPM